MPRQLHLNLFIQARGHHETSWDHPGATAHKLTDLSYYQDLARRAEAARFDSIFFADSLILTGDAARSARLWLEPITLIAALAASTERIGLIATGSATYSEPFNLARQFLSIDHMSRGRVGWNIVTTWMEAAARNFGRDHHAHADRYAMADEFVAAVKGLWDSWADDAIVDDRSGHGVYANTERIRPVDFKGAHYRVAGPLNLPRSPQGRPVLVQAGASDSGRDFASRHAEAVFTAHLEKATAQEFYADIKRRAAKAGRKPEQVVILPGLNPVIGSSEAESKRLLMELNSRMDPEIGRRTLSQRFAGHDFSHLDLDTPLTTADFPDAATLETMKSRAAMIIRLVEREHLTLRELLARFAGGRGHYTFAGTPEQVADLMEDWFSDGAADGFNIMPPVIPVMLDPFIEHVIPILRKRGLFRHEYTGETLREHLGLDRPADGF
jgi:FMN-dependent oxidoreductase (nitrilotriacetate monooxygenase family)